MHEVRLEGSGSVDRTMSLADPDEIVFVTPTIKSVVSLRALIIVSSKKSSRVPEKALDITTIWQVSSGEWSRREGRVPSGASSYCRDRALSRRRGSGRGGTRTSASARGVKMDLASRRSFVADFRG